MSDGFYPDSGRIALNHDLSPREEYERRRNLAQEAEKAIARRDEVVANVRLVIFLATGVLAWLAFFGHQVSPFWLVLPALAFAACLVAHDRLAKAMAKARARSAIYELGLARVGDDWVGKGSSGDRFSDPEHPYAADLDLFGSGSLFQRISTARTRSGEAMLASWLLAPAEIPAIRLRQEAVAELRPNMDFREDLAHQGEDAKRSSDLDTLLAWSKKPCEMPHAPLRIVALVLGILGCLAVIAWIFTNLSYFPLIGVGILDGLFVGWLFHRVGHVLEGVGKASDDLACLEGMLARIESANFQSVRLASLRQTLLQGQIPASKQVASLRRRADLLTWRQNLFFAPISAVLLWGTQVALAIEAWKVRSGPRVARWIEVVAEFEAIASLAAFAFENPADPFAELIEGETLIAVDQVGHPLLPASSCVRNDVCLGGELRVLVISGSNMSGKSTVLRAIGVNVVLALAGASVRASHLRLSPVAIGATLRIQDSLQEGKSRFYAEILRLRLVVDLANGRLPLLFLLDEVLSGTNSHDRLQGASAIVRGLIDRGAIGLVTTHDLALADVANQLAPRAANVHFEDRFENGVMQFDYQMKPGIVRNSNALALMRAVGLEV